MAWRRAAATHAAGRTASSPRFAATPRPTQPTGPNATEWYYPRRLGLDLNAASALRQTPAARYLGLRIQHAKRIDVPLYAYGTALTDGGVARGARRLAKASRIERPTVVDDRKASHLDPLSGAPARNRFLKTVVPFLRRFAR